MTLTRTFLPDTLLTLLMLMGLGHVTVLFCALLDKKTLPDDHPPLCSAMTCIRSQRLFGCMHPFLPWFPLSRTVFQGTAPGNFAGLRGETSNPSTAESEGTSPPSSSIQVRLSFH